MDIAVHKILDDESVEEMCIANGGPWGGNTVNKAFVNLLRTYWGSDFVTKLQQEKQKIWLSMEREFENTKRYPQINERDSLPLISVRVPILLFFEQETRKDITSVKDKNFYINDLYQLVISKATLDQLFGPTVQRIVDTIKNLFSEKLTKVDYIFLVGGFISCPYLTAAIKKAFKEKITILIPDDPQLAVLKGAIQFGKNPNVIKKRIMPRTYGICVTPLYDPSVHDPTKAYLYAGEEKRCYVFAKLVTVGQRVDVDEEIEKKGIPVTSKQSSILLNIYETTEEDVIYMDHPSIKNTHVSLTVPVPHTEEGGDRSIVVYIRFGASEIRARARCTVNTAFGKWYHAIVEYTPKK